MTIASELIKQTLIFILIYSGFCALADDTFAYSASQNRQSQQDFGLRSSLAMGINSSLAERTVLQAKIFQLTSNPECNENETCQRELAESQSQASELSSQIREARQILRSLNGQFLSPAVLWDLSDVYLNGGQVAVTCRRGKYDEFLSEMDCISNMEVAIEMAVLGDKVAKSIDQSLQEKLEYATEFDFSVNPITPAVIGDSYYKGEVRAE